MTSHVLRKPNARSEHLVVTTAGQEVLVYDQVTHCLHHLADHHQRVWHLCDGLHTTDEIAILVDLPSETVCIVVQQLRAAELIDHSPEAEIRTTGTTRRRVLQQAGVVAGIVSLSMPLAAAAQSACTAIIPIGSPCPIGGQPDCCQRPAYCAITSGVYICRVL